MSKDLDGLNRYGLMAEEAWREHRPLMYSRLKEKGLLNRSLRAAQDGAATEVSQMVHNGAFLPDAEEKVLPEWILLPSESDQRRIIHDPESPITKTTTRPVTSGKTSGPTPRRLKRA